MNKKFLKRVAAFALAATMVVGNAAVAMAAESTADGSGSNEGKTPDYPVASITLPVVTDDTMFDYIVDPNGLIAGTASAGADNQHYDWNDFNQSGSLWFQQFASPAAAGAKKFEPTSDKLEVVNNGANDITVKAKVVADANYKGAVTFVTGSTFTTSGKNIYIAAQGSKENVNSAGTALDTAAAVDPVAVKGLGTENAADLSFDLIGNKKNFSLAYDNDEEKYIQKMSTGSSLVWSKGSFNLTGACNTQGTDVWGDDELPKLTVTWSWEDPSLMYAYWDKSISGYWLCLNQNSGFDTSATTITSLTFGGKDVTSGATMVTGSSDGLKWIKLPWAACTAAGVPGGQSSYDIKLVLGSDPERHYTVAN